MSHSTQLLCTFTTIEGLDATIDSIIHNYNIVFDAIYILENVDAPSSLCCTFNITTGSTIGSSAPTTTISLHRKKSTNTLYTINALNMLVAELNGGVHDNKFAVPWENYKNTIMVTAYNNLKKINTRLDKIIKVSNYTK